MIFMAALIFRRPMNAQAALSYSACLHDLGLPIVLFTLGHDVEDHSFAHVERFNSYDSHGLTEIRAVELSERFSFSHVFAQSEHDILRAAKLREWFGVAGQSYDSARAYRDKVYMKTLAQAGGVETPAFAALTSPLDLYRFAAEHDFPCVVKPRAAAGSRGVRIVTSVDDLKAFLQRPLPEHYMIEAFIDGPTFHVDGLMTGDQILFCCASRYVNGCLGFKSGKSLGSVLLDPSHELSRRLFAETKTLLVSLPPAPHLAFHAEFFVDRADRLVFCEVACRPGGSGTVDMIEVAYGLNLYEQWIRRSFGLRIELPERRPWCSAGSLLIPPRRGRLRSIPANAPFDWVVDYRPNSAPGQWWEDPTFSTANVASFIVRGIDADEVEFRIHQLDNWFREYVEWEEAPAV
jgi:predicted ATP-grasp superfamily ATP-dependent carboligase